MSDTIIIGAGAAGLAAGRRLREAGQRVLLVEARDRIGGRIHTDHSHGPAELGAEFIHGDRAASWSVVRAAGLRTIPWAGVRRFAIGGRLLAPADPIGPRAAALYESATSYVGPDVSVAELLGRQTDPADPVLGLALRWLANIEGADPARLSAAALAREHAQSSNGEPNFHILDGYDALVAALAAGLDVRLGAPVARVAWGDQGVRLTLEGGEQLGARHAIVTVPLGVLQSGRPAFDPPLPEPKQRAIAAIAMGHVTKLLLWFARPIWPDVMAISTDGMVATWWPIESASLPTLMGYTGGPAALALAALGEAGAIEQGLRELSTLLGADLAAACLGGRLADWSRDPWSMGAYSYSPVGMGAARADLAAPLASTLYFAGEATVTGGHIATVHGAIESGERAAAELLAARL